MEFGFSCGIFPMIEDVQYISKMKLSLFESGSVFTKDLKYSKIDKNVKDNCIFTIGFFNPQFPEFLAPFSSNLDSLQTSRLSTIF